jgi:hypothetical protein
MRVNTALANPHAGPPSLDRAIAVLEAVADECAALVAG